MSRLDERGDWGEERIGRQFGRRQREPVSRPGELTREVQGAIALKNHARLSLRPSLSLFLTHLTPFHTTHSEYPHPRRMLLTRLPTATLARSITPNRCPAVPPLFSRLPPPRLLHSSAFQMAPTIPTLKLNDGNTIPQVSSSLFVPHRTG